MQTLRIGTALFLAVLSVHPPGSLARGIPEERVHFNPGASSATIEGRIRGDETIGWDSARSASHGGAAASASSAT